MVTASKKRKRQCPHCLGQFDNIHSHNRSSPLCAGPAEDLPGPAATGTTVFHEDEQTAFADDLSLSSNPWPDTAGRSPPSSTHNTEEEVNGFDNEDLYEMFVAECSNRPSQERPSPFSSRIASPLPTGTSEASPQRAQVPAGAAESPPPVEAPPGAPPGGLESGAPFSVESDFQKAKHCFTNQDRSLIKLYSICDQADCPRYLMDKVLAQLKVEMTMNNFDPIAPTITKRKCFMARMHRKFPNPPAEEILVQLESFPEPIKIYRFDAIEQMKAHLVRPDLYGNLEKLNVNPDNRWDQSDLPRSTHMREVTDSPWFKDNVAAANGTAALPSDLVDPGPGPAEPGHIPFLFPLEQYQDATGNDNKETSSLEPVMVGSGLLSSEFNSDPRSRFIIGYMPSFTKKKATPGKKKKKFGASVRDYHKCMSILLEPLVKAQKDPPLIDVLLGDQLRRVRLIIIMAIILGDGKSNDMLCGRVMSNTKTLRLSRASFTPSESAAETSDASVWIKSNVIESVTPSEPRPRAVESFKDSSDPLESSHQSV
jgi:hypothetical protein